MGSIVLDLLCVLCVLTTTGHALICSVCIASYSTFCYGASVVCPEEQVCLSTYTQTTLGGSKLNEAFTRSCGPINQCNNPGSVSIPNGKIKRSTACCFTDDCTPIVPPLPKDIPEPNGVTCATCVSPKSDWCYTEKTIKCTGSENMCILEASHYYEPIEKMLSLRGCATKSICDIGTQEVSYGTINMTMNIKCSNASSPLYSPLLLPFTAAAFLAVMMSWA